MEFNIKNTNGDTGLRFGITQTDARKLLGSDFLSLPVALESTVSRQSFESQGLCLYFTKECKLAEIVFTPPAEPVLDSLKLLSDSMEDIVQALRQLDPALQLNYNGLVSRTLGITLFAQTFSENGLTPFESASVFRTGFYDEIMSSRP